MKVIDCQQGTPEWLNARLGLPTASCFDKIITKSGNISDSAREYMGKLLAEWFLGHTLDDYQSPYMERGSQMEHEAVAFYEMESDTDTTPVGLCLTDCGRAGASPDRLVGDDGLLEIKCPAASTHMVYLIDGPPDKYRPQVQGQLWVTGREWVDLLCFHPTLPNVRVRAERDEKYIDKLSALVLTFADQLAEAKKGLAEQRATHMARKHEANAEALAGL